MWKLLKILGHLLKALIWTALLLMCFAIVLLYICEHGLPQSIINKVSKKLSSEEMIVDIERITFSIKNGLHFHNVKAYPRKLASESFGSVEDVIIKFSLSSSIDNANRLKSVTLKNVNSPHHPRNIFRKLAELDPDKKDKDKPRKKIPTISPFKLIVEDSHILGFKAKKASATLTINDPVVSFDDIILEWPNTNEKMQIAGRIYIYLDSELLDGYVSGEAFPENVTGFLTELETDTVILEIDHFSDLKDPVKVDCGFKVDLQTSDFAIDIDLNIGSCAYRKVPLKYARGNIKAYGTNTTIWVDIQGLKTATIDGKLEGSLYYDDEDGNDSLKVHALSTMKHKDVTTIIDILTHGELKPLHCENPPIITADGVVSLSTNAPLQHNLTGKIKMGTASIFGLKVQKADCDYAVTGDEAILKNVIATTSSGGNVTGSAVFAIRSQQDLPPSIVAQASFNKVDLSDLAHLFSITNSKIGECSGNLELSGILGTNQLHTLNGQGDFRIKDGRINQLRLFAGLTEYMSRNIPGISSLVNQSACSLQFTIKDGVMSTDNFDIEGDVFNITGRGTYDMLKDDIDLVIHVALFKKRTIAGRITRIVTFPFKKLLLEFKLYGTIEDPQWSYVTILEKIVDQIPGTNKNKNKNKKKKKD